MWQPLSGQAFREKNNTEDTFHRMLAVYSVLAQPGSSGALSWVLLVPADQQMLVSCGEKFGDISLNCVSIPRRQE